MIGLGSDKNILPKGHKCAPPGNSHWVVTMGPKVISMLSHSCLKIVPKLPLSCLQSCPKMVLRLSLSCLKIVFFPTYLQVVSRLSPGGVKGNHSCESTWLIINSVTIHTKGQNNNNGDSTIKQQDKGQNGKKKKEATHSPTTLRGGRAQVTKKWRKKLEK